MPAQPAASGRMPQWAACGLVALAYFLAARLGLLLAFEQTNASPVWPPSGLALAALMILGPRVWPGIWAGAFFANLTTFLSYGTASIAPTLGISGIIALGNTLEALAGAYLLRRWHAWKLFEQTRGVLRFVSVALAMSLVGSGIGPAVLCAATLVPWEWYRTIWVTWWLGDAIGVLTVAPVLLSWPAHRGIFWTRRRRLELAAFLAAFWAVVGLVFGRWSGAEQQDVSLAYLVIPCVIIAAFRFGAWGVALAVVMTSGIAVWGTVHGLGPLSGVPANTALLMSQVFLGVVAVTGLLLAAALVERRHIEEALRQAHEALEQRVRERTLRLETMNAVLQEDIVERKRTERRLMTQYAVVYALEESATIDEAAPRVIQAICEHAGTSSQWDVGAVWYVDQAAGALRRSKGWHAPSKTFPEFEGASRQLTFPPGVGLPGRVWAGGKAVWVPDCAKEPNFPRAAVAAKEGLHAAFALPIRIHGELFGVMEFFSQQIQEPDQDLMSMLTTIGIQIGLFIERRRAEEAFHETKARMRRLVESNIIGMITADVEGRILEANEAFLTMLGYTKQELPLRWQALTPPDRGWTDAEAMMQLKRFGTVSPWERECLHKDGRRIPVLVGAVLLPATQPETYVGFVVNMTELKQTREALEERTVELNRQRVAALNLAQDAMEAKQSAERANQELREAQLQLVQAAKLESVGRLAAGVAHEVKNPLATIMIGLEHLQDNFAVSDPEVQGLLKDMTHSVERADRVIRGLLDFSAPNELARKPVEVHGLIEQALELVRHPLTKAHVTVSKAFAQGLPPVPVDAHKMEQVFVNLFLNAMQAMPAGGALHLATRLDGRAGVLIEITDTGTGIPEDKLPKIFDPFFTTKPAGKGTGLGLCVTKRIVELHGGTIAIGNRPTGGVKATITLRAQEERSHGHARGQEAHSARG